MIRNDTDYSNSKQRIVLTNESCFDLLSKIKDNSIDLFLIDPPYEVSRDTNFQSGQAKGTDTDRFRVSMDFGRHIPRHCWILKKIIPERVFW